MSGLPPSPRDADSVAREALASARAAREEVRRFQEGGQTLENNVNEMRVMMEEMTRNMHELRTRQEAAEHDQLESLLPRDFRYPRGAPCPAQQQMSWTEWSNFVARYVRLRGQERDGRAGRDCAAMAEIYEFFVTKKNDTNLRVADQLARMFLRGEVPGATDEMAAIMTHGGKKDLKELSSAPKKK